MLYSLQNHTQFIQAKNFPRVLKAIKSAYPTRSIHQTNTTQPIYLTNIGEVYVKKYEQALPNARIKNEIEAYKTFIDLGFKVPEIVSYGTLSGQAVLITKAIPSSFFLDKQRFTIHQLDKYFVHYYCATLPIFRMTFGSLIPNEELYANETLISYKTFIRSSTLYFLDKIRPKLAEYKYETICTLESILFGQLQSSTIYMLQHGDIAPKHIYIQEGILGLIDTERACFADPSLDLSIWVTRTCLMRDKESTTSILQKYMSIRPFSMEYFLYNAFRELLIQSYYESSLQDFYIAFHALFGEYIK